MLLNNSSSSNAQNANKERSKSSNAVSSQSQSQQPPPHMIAEFPDYYTRNDDIIRPKPRRLVDMRRSAIGPGIEFSLSAESSHLANMNASNAPMLPARPLIHSSYTSKPLPPKPSNAHSPMLSPTSCLSKQQQHFQCLVNPDNYLQYPPFCNNDDRHPPVVMGFHRKEYPANMNVGVTPSFTSSQTNHSSAPNPGSGGNMMVNMSQRSVPSLPQLLQSEQQQQPLQMRQSFSPPPNSTRIQQQRGFLSPQPRVPQQQQQPYPDNGNLNSNRPLNMVGSPVSASGSGSASNLHSPNSNGNTNANSAPVRFYNSNADNGSNAPYYCDLIPKFSNPELRQHQIQRQIVTNPKVRPVVEWKSVDNLQLVQQHLQVANNCNDTPVSTRTNGTQEQAYEERVNKTFQNSSVVKNLSLAFEMNSNLNRSKHTSNEYEIPKPVASHRRRDEHQENNDTEFPVYDRIRSPPTVVIKNDAISPRQDKSRPSESKNIRGSVFSPVLSPTALNNSSQPESKTKLTTSQSIDGGGSLGRSSASDYDFSSSVGSTSTVKAIVQDQATNESNETNASVDNRNRSTKNSSTPSSKLRSKSRRNILQHLSAEELQELKNGTNLLARTNNNVSAIVHEKTANNTGTGGSSSSDGSSGHASMSDSQTSGSPPAEYGKIADGDSPSLNLTGYKSVLKSVPEDEQSSILNSSGHSVTASTPRFEKSDTTTGSGSGGGRGGAGGNSSNSSSGAHRKSSSSSKSRHRTGNKDSILLGNGNNGLEDIKQAIEQLTLKSSTTTTTILDKSQNRFLANADHHSSYSTSTYSSMSGSECDRHRKSSTNHHNNSNSGNSHHNTSANLMRHSSLETINTQVTSADEFVWVDSHNRLVELQQFPWSNVDILKVIEKSSRLRDNLERISMESVPRVSYLLQRALVRIAREVQRLSKMIGFCSKHEITSAFRIILAPGLADSCIKACLRAAAMYSVSTTDPLHRQSKSARAGLHLHVGRFQRWMVEVRLGRFVHEFAAIHFTAGIENLIEEIFAQAMAFISSSETMENHFNNNLNAQSAGSANQRILTAALLEQAISFNADLWGLLQPFAHLNAGRMASGALAIPRWSSVASVDSSGSSSTTIGGTHDDVSHRLHQHNKSLEQSLLTTCVGSTGELSDILAKVITYHHKKVPFANANGLKSLPPAWSPSAVHALFHFMRCSQLEAADELANLNASTATLRSDNIEKSQQNVSSRPPIQELVYERPFIVLPPLVEWVRVATAHADYRHSTVIDKDDVLQAARLLLPGIDCPVRMVGSDEFAWPKRTIDEFECNRRLKVDLAFKMLHSGRSDLVTQALLLMPPTKANTFNDAGLPPLILASIRGDDLMVRVLLDGGADVDLETPANGQKYPQANSETQSWTALTFAALMGHANIVKILLERGANVEGGARPGEDKPTQTPLQVAVATGHLEIVTVILNYGANPFHSTLVRDTLCYMGSAQRGSFSAISVATSHGQRAILHKLLSHPLNATQAAKEVLSLEEILAEGIQHQQKQSADTSTKQLLQYGRSIDESANKLLTKSQMKVLQEAMYQSAENGYLEITLDLRNLGVPWTLHTWINTLETANDLRCETIVDQLLHDFLQILPNEDFSQGHFVDDCLPLLLTIFRNGKNEGTTLLLAEIFQTCYGKDPIKEIRDTCVSNSGTRIDPKYVNNPELSDVQFRVEGKIFYAHKIVLVTASARFKQMLKGAPESNPPLLQISDIRYPIFKLLMEYLYNGGCDTLNSSLENDDILELMAAANFFQLDGLIRFCESKCSQMVNVESVVSLYIHAKVYNASQLLEYCQGFLLQNMVAILMHDDSVRRLIFGKKLQNHDVLAGLLITLQDRLKCIKPNRSVLNSSSSNSNSATRKS